MTDAAVPVSVVVTGRGRPDALRRCLMALRLQDHPRLEVVLATGPASREVAAGLGLAGMVKTLEAAPGNLALERTLGLRASAGELVAFLADTAVPEPGWITRLVTAFDDPRVEAATGFVRAPEGIVHCQRAAWVDPSGHARPLQADARLPSLHQGAAGAAVRLWPAGMAFRRETLAAFGGFDPAFGAGMEVDDLALRLAAEALITAIVPRAEVQDTAGPRDTDAAPRALGADLAVFLRKHAPGADTDAPLAALRAQERRRALRLMVDGRIEPRDVGRRLAALEAGFATGMAREIAPLLPVGAPDAPFLRLPGTGPRPARVHGGWIWSGRRLARQGAAAAREGAVVTVLRLSPTALRHSMRFTDAGYWLQTGGLWGRSLPDRPAAHRLSPRGRIRAEVTRIAAVRPVDGLHG